MASQETKQIDWLEAQEWTKSTPDFETVKSDIYQRSLEVLQRFNLADKIKDWVISQKELYSLIGEFNSFKEEYMAKTWKEYDYQANVLMFMSIWSDKMKQLTSDLWIKESDFNNLKIEQADWKLVAISSYDAIGDYLKGHKEQYIAWMKKFANDNIKK